MTEPHNTASDKPSSKPPATNANTPRTGNAARSQAQPTYKPTMTAHMAWRCVGPTISSTTDTRDDHV